jgi:hypothetical protein
MNVFSSAKDAHSCRSLVGFKFDRSHVGRVKLGSVAELERNCGVGMARPVGRFGVLGAADVVCPRA